MPNIEACTPFRPLGTKYIQQVYCILDVAARMNQMYIRTVRLLTGGFYQVTDSPLGCQTRV